MSYICLMVNPNGAVAATDSRLTSGNIHMDGHRKCFALPKRQLIWAICGPVLRFGVSFPRATRRILNSDQPMEAKLDQVARVVDGVTRVGPDPGPFCLVAAQRENGGFTVWDFRQVRDATGKRYTFHRRRWRVCDSGAVFLQAGANHRLLPPLQAAQLNNLSYQKLRAAARNRAALAVRVDKQRKAADRRYNQTVGGQVLTVSLRVKGR